MHEQSETIQGPDGRWYNVYGQGTPQAGQPLPDSPTFGSVEEATAAARSRSESMPQALQVNPALVGEPPETPPTFEPPTRQGIEPESGPGFIQRMGGPRPGQTAGRGFFDTLGQYATSDMGRNLIGALGVGLAGLRNPRDQGALQQRLMDMHIQGIGERAQRTARAESMTGLFTGLSEAQGLIAKGDMEGASQALSALSKNRAIMENPAAMSALITLQSQLSQRMSTRAGLKALTEGPDITSGTELLRRAGEKGVDPELAFKAAPLVMKENKPIVKFDGPSQSVVVLSPQGQILSVQKWGEGDLPVTLKDINSIADVDTQRHLTGALAQLNQSYPDFVQAYNGRRGDTLEIKAQNRINSIKLLGWAASQPKEGGDLKTEPERSAEAIRVERTYLDRKEPVPAEVKAAADRARRIQEQKVEVAEKGAYAGAAGRREEGKNKTQGEANRFFFDRRTMEKAPGTVSVGELEKSPKYVEVEPNQAMSISQTSSGLTIATELADLIRNNRDIFPEKKSDVTWKTIGATIAPGTMGRIDPRVARMQTLALAIPNLVRALGDTANIAVAERQITQTGLGLRVMNRDSAEASLKTLVSILNSSLRKRGFEGINVDELLKGESEDARLRKILEGK